MTLKHKNRYHDGFEYRDISLGLPPLQLQTGLPKGFNISRLIKAAQQQKDKKVTDTTAKKSQLFVDRRFISHSGQELLWKVECDAISEAEWLWAAARVAERFTFREVHGIPGGGIPFEKALRPYIKSDGDFFLIVDDVLTTGTSMEKAKKGLRARHKEVPRIGVVLFARISPPPWIGALWQLWGDQ